MWIVKARAAASTSPLNNSAKAVNGQSVIKGVLLSPLLARKSRLLTWCLTCNSYPKMAHR